MGAQWSWTVRLLGLFLLVPVRVSRVAGIVRQGRPSMSAALLTWTILWLLIGYLLFFAKFWKEHFGCFGAAIQRTMRTYSFRIVINLVAVLIFFTNLLCFARMYRLDLVNVIGRSVELHAKAAGNAKFRPSAMSNTLKALLIFLLLSKFSRENVIPILCISGESLPWLDIILRSVSCAVHLPSTCMVIVFFVFLHTAEESLALIHRRLLALYASRTPRPFLESGRAPSPESGSRESLTPDHLRALRIVHLQLVEFVTDVMRQFQTDILCLFLMSFFQMIMYTYSIVFNHMDVFRNKFTFFFVCHSLHLIVNLLTGLWLVCSGPTAIKDKQRDLMNSTARLSTILNIPSDLAFEIRIFQMQVRNHNPSFEVFGAFELSFHLLFKMCASIVSYIVVLIQFD